MHGDARRGAAAGRRARRARRNRGLGGKPRRAYAGASSRRRQCRGDRALPGLRLRTGRNQPLLGQGVTMTVDLTPTPSFRLDGKRALVTGAGRGIGLAAASALAEAGAHVTLASRTTQEIEEAAE